MNEPRVPLLRVIKKEPMDAVEFFLRMQGKPRITAEQVHQMFIDAIGTKRLPVPALGDCEPIAKTLTEFFSLGPVPKVGQARYHKAREYLLNALNSLRKVRDASARKYWRLGHTKLAEEIQSHARQIESIPSKRKVNYHAELAGAMESFNQIDDPLLDRAGSINAANTLLDLWDVYPPPNWNWHGRVRWISDLAQEAWRKAGRAPRDRVMRDDHPPLIEFVALALSAIWQDHERHTISAALRERRGAGKGTKQKQSRK